MALLRLWRVLNAEVMLRAWHTAMQRMHEGVVNVKVFITRFKIPALLSALLTSGNSKTSRIRQEQRE